MEKEIMEHGVGVIVGIAGLGVTIIMAIVTFVIKGWFIKQQNFNIALSGKVDTILEKLGSNDVKNSEQQKDIDIASAERKRLFTTVESHGRRISGLETFTKVLTSVHNKEHPDNTLRDDV